MNTPTSPEAEGWIPWEGGKCPVNPSAWVEYRMNSPFVESQARASQLDWETRDPYLTITAYRVIS